MKKRLLATVLSLVLCLSLVSAPAMAASTTIYPDVQNHWAREYITDMTRRGLFTGYDDGLFRPDRDLNATEALTLCARIAAMTYNLDGTATAQMTSRWMKDLSGLLGSSYAWFYQYAAVALECGVISWADLSQRVRAQALDSSLQRELFSVYMVRAMGMDSVAQNLSIHNLDFKDAASVTANYVPYVYLLVSCGVLTGDELGYFNPAQPITRATSATMMSRILDYMENAGLEPELAEYTDYTWQVGTISRITAGSYANLELELTNSLSGDKKVVVPVSASLYKNDRSCQTSDLKPGLYAKACYDTAGRVFALRTYDTAKFGTASGTVESISRDSITVQVGGGRYTYGIDRFTEVAAGGRAGDRELIDLGEDYGTATVLYNEAGTAVSVQLRGGTTAQEGLISRVVTLSNGGYDLWLTGFDGVVHDYIVPAGASVTISGLNGTLRPSHKGYFATVRVSNEDPTDVKGVEVDVLELYVQGSIYTLSASGRTVTVIPLGGSVRDAETYQVASDAEITYDGRAVRLADLAASDFVTLKLSSVREASMVSAWPGSVVTDGELTDITYGASETVLTVTKDDGTTVQFRLDMEDLPDIERNGKDSTLLHLVPGDWVSVTVRFQEVVLVEAEAQSANAEGVITTVTHSATESTLTMAMDDGTTQTYRLRESGLVTQDGKSVARTALQPGWRLSMVVSGGEILSAEVESSFSISNRVNGLILYIDYSTGEILFQQENGTVIRVIVSSYTKVTQAVDAATINWNYLDIGDSLTVYGAYNGGEFDATLIIVE